MDNYNMVQFDKDGTRFFLCARGITIHRKRVLLFNVIGWDWWALPGGRVEMLEQTEETLKREMKEELGTNVVVGRLVWVVENFFKERDKTYHELGLYYLMKMPGESGVLNSFEYTSQDGPVTLRFRWFLLSELEKVNLQPIFLKKELTAIPTRTKHVVWHDFYNWLPHPLFNHPIRCV